MSRSYKKKPYFGNCSVSNKKWKRQVNKKLRRLVKAKIHTEPNLNLKDVSDPWESPQDGKHFWKEATKKDLSK